MDWGWGVNTKRQTRTHTRRREENTWLAYSVKNQNTRVRGVEHRAHHRREDMGTAGTAERKEVAFPVGGAPLVPWYPLLLQAAEATDGG